jgi:hypothetical protein
VWGPFCWICVRAKSYTYTCTVPRTPEHAHWLAHFCWCLLIVTEEKGKATEISYSDARSLVTFSRGFILWQQGMCFFMLTMIQKRKNTKTLGNLINTWGATPSRTNQIASCFDALSITYCPFLKRHIRGECRIWLGIFLQFLLLNAWQHTINSTHVKSILSMLKL